MSVVYAAFAKAKLVQFFKKIFKSCFHTIHLQHISSRRNTPNFFSIHLIFVVELKTVVMDFTYIKNRNVLKIVYNRRIISKSYKMVVGYRRVKKQVIQLVTS